MARPKSGNALSSAEKQRRYRARVAAKAAATMEARIAEAVIMAARDSLDVTALRPKALGELIWQRLGRRAALAVRTRISQLAQAEDNAKAVAQAKLRAAAAAAREAEFRASWGSGAFLGPTSDRDYQLLGLSRGPLTADKIIKAYRAKVKKLHPDQGGGGDSDTLTALQEARNALLKEAGR